MYIYVFENYFFRFSGDVSLGRLLVQKQFQFCCRPGWAESSQEPDSLVLINAAILAELYSFLFYRWELFSRAPDRALAANAT